MAADDRTVTVDDPSNNETQSNPDSAGEEHWRNKKDDGIWFYIKRIWWTATLAAALIGMSIYLIYGRDDLSAFEKNIMICTAAAFNLRELITLCYTQRNKYIQSEGLCCIWIAWVILYGLPAFCYNLPNTIVGHRQESNETWTALHVISVIITINGHIFNSFAELQRKWWLDQPENKGKLYTKGLFRLCRHPNYLGDLLIFIGWYLLTRNWIPFIMPLLMIYSFYKEYIPEIEDFLAQEFGDEWKEYERNVKPMIPFIC